MLPANVFTFYDRIIRDNFTEAEDDNDKGQYGWEINFYNPHDLMK